MLIYTCRSSKYHSPSDSQSQHHWWKCEHVSIKLPSSDHDSQSQHQWWKHEHVSIKLSSSDYVSQSQHQWWKHEHVSIKLILHGATAQEAAASKDANPTGAPEVKKDASGKEVATMAARPESADPEVARKGEERAVHQPGPP